MDTHIYWIKTHKCNFIKCVPMKQIHKPGESTKTPSGMFELNLNLLFTNTLHGPLNELCTASLTRTVTDYTFERRNWAYGIVLLNNFTGVNNRGGLKSFNVKKVTLWTWSYSNTCWQVGVFPLPCFLCNNFVGPPYWPFPLQVREWQEGREKKERRRELTRIQICEALVTA